MQQTNQRLRAGCSYRYDRFIHLQLTSHHAKCSPLRPSKHSKPIYSQLAFYCKLQTLPLARAQGAHTNTTAGGEREISSRGSRSHSPLSPMRRSLMR
jgi:hypothetical protein